MRKHLWSTIAIVIMAFLALGSTNPPPPKPIGPKTAKEARKEQLEKHFKFDGSHKGLTNLIKASMNDPGSYEHVDTRYVDNIDYLIVITTFRGRNAFNALVKQTITAKVDLEGRVIEVVSKTP